MEPKNRFNLVILILLLSSLLTPLGARTFYVANSGLDSNFGSLEQPLKTIQQAARLASPGDEVVVRGGIYREVVVPSRSGTVGNPITFRNYEQEEVIVSGTELIPASKWQLRDKGIYQSDVSLPLGADNQLFLDGRMMNEAQFPNTTLDVSHPVKLLAKSGSYTGTLEKAIGTIEHEALNQVSNYWAGAVLHITLGKVWVAETAKVIASGPDWIQFKFREGGDYRPAPGNPFFLTGKLSELDSPGEWFYDAAAHTLHFWPPGDDSPAGHVVEYKARKFVFDLRGKSHLVVRGLKIFAATIITDTNSQDIILDALHGRYLSHFSTLVRWKTGLADSGIVLDGKSNSLRNSILAFSAGNGVSLLGSGNTVSNNIIHDVDYSGGVGAGINTGGGCREATIDHNTIYCVGHRMIDIGNLKAGVVQHNDLWAGGIQVTDFGGIYDASTDGDGTRICFNQIHDTDAASSGTAGDNNAKGIYMDNGSSNYVIDHNAVWNVGKAMVVNARPGEISRNILVLNNSLDGNKWSLGWKNCQTPGMVVANNIFCSKAQPGVGATVSNNLFPDINPQFIAGSHLELQATSPARHAGLVHTPYVVQGVDGRAPDLGAFPYGEKPWNAGSTLWAEYKRTGSEHVFSGASRESGKGF